MASAMCTFRVLTQPLLSQRGIARTWPGIPRRGVILITASLNKSSDQETKKREVVDFDGTDDSNSSKEQRKVDESVGKSGDEGFEEGIQRLREASREQVVGAGEQSPNFWLGVLEETRLIQWPSFPYVLSTTGLVLAVIFAATLALLTVNAVFASISDAVFANEAVATAWHLR